MPEGDQDHGLVPVRPAIALAAFYEALDLAFGQVLAGADVGIFGPARRDFPFYGVWGYDFQEWFWHMKQSSRCDDFRQSSPNTESLQASEADSPGGRRAIGKHIFSNRKHPAPLKPRRAGRRPAIHHDQIGRL